MDLASPAILGGILNSLTIRTDDWVVNWLTPIWILGVGALAGVVAVLLLCGIGYVLSRVPAISSFSENRRIRLITGAVIGLILLAIMSPWIMGQLRTHWAAQPDANKTADVLWAFGPALLAAVITGWAAVVLVSRRTMEELPLLFQEGPLFWISATIGGFALFGILGTVIVRDPEMMLNSLRRWPELGQKQYTLTIPASEAGQFKDPTEHRLELDPALQRNELRTLTFLSDESLRVSAFASAEKGNAPSFDVSAEEPLTYVAVLDPNSPFGDLKEIRELYVRNYGDREAKLNLTAETAPATPEMLTVPVIAVGVLALFFLFLVLWGLFPKLSAIAFATAKSEMNTPFYMLLSASGAFLLFLFVWLPYNTFGEDIKMLKFASLDVMLVIAILQAVWSASSSVADEVEGRTALTVLSKPVGRRDFILGKFLGIAWIVMVMFFLFGSVVLLSVAYKPIFDAREGGKAPDRPNIVEPLGLLTDPRDTSRTQEEVNWEVCFAEMASSLPPIVLVYCETLVMAAVSVAISTRLGLVANFTICFTVYALGHLTPLLVQTAVVAERFEAVIFMGQLIAAVLPVLEYFDVKAAIAKGTAVNLAYVGATFIYTMLYSAIAMLLALVLFEDRDLA